MKFNWKIFIVLALMGIVAALLILPYIYELTGDLIKEAQQASGLDGALFNFVIILQTSVMYVIAALIGVFLYRRAGFRMPLLEKYIGKEDITLDWRSWLFYSVGCGIAIAVLIIAGDYFFLQFGSPLSLLESDLPSWWRGLLGAYSAAVGEEILFRLLLMTLLTLLLHKLFRLPHTVAVWISVITVAMLFGMMHLPATAALVELTPIVLFRALLLNGIAAVFFGWLYWKIGLEAAMLAHFTTDVIVHGLLQIFV